MDYTRYTEISVSALTSLANSQRAVDKKRQVLEKIEQSDSKIIKSVLFYGFNPAILANTSKKISVTAITDCTKQLLNNLEVDYTYIPEDQLGNTPAAFDWVVALDEYFTFAKSESEQIANVTKLISLSNHAVITSLRDYKNQEFQDREFSRPLAIYNNHNPKLYLEYHNYDYTDRYSWTTAVHEISGKNMQYHGPFARRSMFFKQLARFSADAGATNFRVHKDLMYKSLIRKNYEHVITIAF